MIRPVVFAVAVSAQSPTTRTFKIKAGCIHEYQVQTGEEISAMIKQSLLDQVLHAAWYERCTAILLLARQLFAEPCHRAIKMMQIKLFTAGDHVVLAPAIGCAVGAATNEPMQHCKENRSFQFKVVLAVSREFVDYRPTPALIPQPFKYQGWSNPSAGDLCRRVIINRTQHHRLFGKSCAGSQQPFELTAGLQVLVPAERGDHLLANLVTVTSTLDDLQVGATVRGFPAKVHAFGPCPGAHRDS